MMSAGGSPRMEPPQRVTKVEVCALLDAAEELLLLAERLSRRLGGAPYSGRRFVEGKEVYFAPCAAAEQRHRSERPISHRSSSISGEALDPHDEGGDAADGAEVVAVEVVVGDSDAQLALGEDADLAEADRVEADHRPEVVVDADLLLGQVPDERGRSRACGEGSG